MGVYNNYSPLGVDSTPNLRMGARMLSLGSSSSLLIRISCLDSVRPIEGWSSTTHNTFLFHFSIVPPINSQEIDRSLCWLARCPLFSTGRCLSLGLRSLPILYWTGERLSQVFRSLTRRHQTPFSILIFGRLMGTLASISDTECRSFFSSTTFFVSFFRSFLS